MTIVGVERKLKFGRRPSRAEAGMKDFSSSAAVAHRNVPAAKEMVADRLNLINETNVRETALQMSSMRCQERELMSCGLWGVCRAGGGLFDCGRTQ